MLVALAGCGSVRIDEAGSTLVPPTEAEQSRQDTALSTLVLQRTAEQAAGSATAELAPVLEQVSADAGVQLLALGGVWSPSGRHLQPPLPGSTVEQVLSGLESTSAQLRNDLDTAEPEAARLLAAIVFNRTLRAQQLRTVLGESAQAAQPEWPQALDPVAAGPLIQTFDAVGQAWEIAAAQEDEPATAAAAAQLWRGQAYDLAALAGVAGTDDDPRQVSYAIDTTDLTATIAGLRAQLAPAWLAQVGATNGEDRRRVLDLALDAAAQAGMGAPGAQVPAVIGGD